MSFQAGSFHISPQDAAKLAAFRQTLLGAVDRIGNDEMKYNDSLNEKNTDNCANIITLDPIPSPSFTDPFEIHYPEVPEITQYKNELSTAHGTIQDLLAHIAEQHAQFEKSYQQTQHVNELLRSAQQEILHFKSLVPIAPVTVVDIDHELKKFVGLVGGNDVEDKLKETSRKYIAEIQGRGESFLSLYYTWMMQPGSNCRGRGWGTIYIITTESVYQTDASMSEFTSQFHTEDFYRSYRFVESLSVQLCAILISYTQTALASGIDRHDILSKFNKIKDILHAIPGTEYSRLKAPWKQMKTPRGAPEQFINIQTMEITDTPPYYTSPVSYPIVSSHIVPSPSTS